MAKTSKAAAANLPRTPVNKQRFNVYTMMLLVSLFALITACTVLWLELDRFKDSPESKNWWWDTSAVQMPA